MTGGTKIPGMRWGVCFHQHEGRGRAGAGRCQPWEEKAWAGMLIRAPGSRSQQAGMSISTSELPARCPGPWCWLDLAAPHPFEAVHTSPSHCTAWGRVSGGSWGCLGAQGGLLHPPRGWASFRTPEAMGSDATAEQELGSCRCQGCGKGSRRLLPSTASLK